MGMARPENALIFATILIFNVDGGYPPITEGRRIPQGNICQKRKLSGEKDAKPRGEQ